ncbi:syntaxin [Forsythia ovata]|uniref:Syntaxin n=1 Tax=Forsythia ovata TaxID=205694 RepID=A0ABD1SNJ3_9LAMI
MLVAHSFDLWQKDTFFSAAEEVQQSADIMESAYRTWLRARKEGVTAQILDALSRELQMALGTAKWQLEEFERAVRLSYRNHADEVTKTRHRQFVSVIEDQISRVEATLKESYTVDGNQPFSWVNLDEEERDDLALFLSGTPDTPCTKLGEPATSPFKEKSNTRKDDRLDSKVGSKAQIPIKTKGFEEIVTSDVEASCFIEPEEKEIPETRDEPSSRRARNLPGVSALEIIIDSDNEQRNALVEATPKEKGSKPFFWRSRCEDHPQAKGGVLTYTKLKTINCMNQLFKRTQRSQRQQQISPTLPVNSIRFILALMLTIFLVVPFLFYSA